MCEKLIRKDVLRGVVNLREVPLETLRSLHILTQSHIHKLKAINLTWELGCSSSLLVVCQSEDCVGQPFFEAWIIAELLEQLRMI